MVALEVTVTLAFASAATACLVHARPRVAVPSLPCRSVQPAGLAMVPVIEFVDRNMTMVSPACTVVGRRTTWAVRLPELLAAATNDSVGSAALALGSGERPMTESAVARTAMIAARGRRWVGVETRGADMLVDPPDTSCRDAGQSARVRILSPVWRIRPPALPMGLVRYCCEVRPVSWSYADPVPRGSLSRSGCAASVTTMLTRALRVVLIVLLLALSGGAVAADATSATAARKARFECHGIDRDAVRGTDPTYTHKTLSDFRNHKRLCGGLWLPTPRRYLVPQGLAVTGSTAWVSGFRYRPGYGERPCQLRRINLVTGQQLAFHAAIYGRVGQRPRTYCRHGGGILQRGGYLWIVEKNKLWQVDPSARSSVLNARRVWRIKAPARGSAIVATKKRIGLVPVRRRRVVPPSTGSASSSCRSRASSTSALGPRGPPRSARWHAPGCPPSSRARRSTARAALPGALLARLR